MSKQSEMDAEMEREQPGAAVCPRTTYEVYRFQAACAAMQSIIAKTDFIVFENDETVDAGLCTARGAVRYADALLVELAKTTIENAGTVPESGFADNTPWTRTKGEGK